MEEKVVALIEKHVDVGMVLRYAGAVVVLGVVAHLLTLALRNAEANAADRAGRKSWLQTSPVGAYLLPLMPVIVAVGLALPLRLAGFLAPFVWVLVGIAAGALGYIIYGVAKQRLGLKEAAASELNEVQPEEKEKK
jgi:hypothetical protein